MISTIKYCNEPGVHTKGLYAQIHPDVEIGLPKRFRASWRKWSDGINQAGLKKIRASASGQFSLILYFIKN